MTQHCTRCGKGLEPGAVYTVRVAEGRVRKCLRCAVLHRPMLRRSLWVAVIVGTALTALNQGDVLLDGGLTGSLVWKISLTYVVPFCVATYAGLANAHGSGE